MFENGIEFFKQHIFLANPAISRAASAWPSASERSDGKSLSSRCNWRALIGFSLAVHAVAYTRKEQEWRKTNLMLSLSDQVQGAMSRRSRLGKWG